MARWLDGQPAASRIMATAWSVRIAVWTGIVTLLPTSVDDSPSVATATRWLPSAAVCVVWSIRVCASVHNAMPRYGTAARYAVAER
jgi:hypothetical protein